MAALETIRMAVWLMPSPEVVYLLAVAIFATALTVVTAPAVTVTCSVVWSGQVIVTLAF